MPTSAAFVSVREASELIGVCRQTIRAEVKAGNLTGFKQGTKLFVSRRSVERWIAEREDATSPARRTGSAVLPTLPRSKGGNNRGVRAGREIVALYKGADTKKRPASSR